MDQALVQKFKLPPWFLGASYFQFNTGEFLHCFILTDYGGSLKLLKLGYL